MSTKLDRFLDSIDPSRTFEKLWARAGVGFNSFVIKSTVETNYFEFKRFLAAFFCHMENEMLLLSPPRNPDFDIDFDRCYRLLKKEFGDQADKVTFNMARNGIDGGLYGVLKTVAKLMVEEYAGNEIGARVSHFWDELTLDEKLAVPQEYLQKYKHLLPSDTTEKSAARILSNFRKVLEEHPRLILRLRQVGR